MRVEHEVSEGGLMGGERLQKAPKKADQRIKKREPEGRGRKQKLEIHMASRGMSDWEEGAAGGMMRMEKRKQQIGKEANGKGTLPCLDVELVDTGERLSKAVMGAVGGDKAQPYYHVVPR